MEAEVAFQESQAEHGRDGCLISVRGRRSMSEERKDVEPRHGRSAENEQRDWETKNGSNLGGLWAGVRYRCQISALECGRSRSRHRRKSARRLCNMEGDSWTSGSQGQGCRILKREIWETRGNLHDRSQREFSVKKLEARERENLGGDRTRPDRMGWGITGIDR